MEFSSGSPTSSLGFLMSGGDTYLLPGVVATFFGDQREGSLAAQGATTKVSALLFAPPLLAEFGVNGWGFGVLLGRGLQKMLTHGQKLFDINGLAQHS